jgi:hypothetical protein
MAQRAKMLFLVAVVVAWCRPSAAEIMYGTGFEDPPFANGSQLSGQDGWFAPSVDNPPGFPFNLNPGAAIISTALPRSGAQSLQVLGGDLQADAGILAATGGYYNAIGSYRRAVNYDAGEGGVTRVQADIFVSGPETPGDNFFSASLGARGGDGNARGELAISSDGQVHAYSGNDNVPTFLFNAPVTLGQWHTLAIVDDFGAGTMSFYVDGSLLGTSAFVSGATGTIIKRGALLAYAGPDTADNQRAEYAAYYDNFSIATVPEPSSLGLAAIGALVIAGCGLRRRGMRKAE